MIVATEANSSPKRIVTTPLSPPSYPSEFSVSIIDGYLRAHHTAEDLKSTHATNVELHCLRVAVAVGYLDISVSLYAAISAGALTAAADVIALHVLQILWYPGTPGVRD